MTKLFKPVFQRDPVHAWHMDVGDDAVGAVLRHQWQIEVSGGTGLNPVPQRPHKPGYGNAQGIIVVDDGYKWFVQQRRDLLTWS